MRIGIRGAIRCPWRCLALCFTGRTRVGARSTRAWVTRPGSLVHRAFHPAPAYHAAMPAAVSCSENRPEDDEASQREGPKPKVPAQRPQSALRTMGKIKNKVAGDSQRRGRDQRYEVNH
jgi:hypothetical protein